MIEPGEVGLIIFDTDGTLVSSLPATYEAIRRAFARLGWPVNFTQQDIAPFFGNPYSTKSGGLYEFITPAGSHLAQAELREILYEEYPACFREMAGPFPGVTETLARLQRRGYRLALYTNASSRYLEMVLAAVGLRDCFDHVECVQEQNLTKTGLVRRIKEKFDCPMAAVVGDRIHDIEAARETGSLSIGARFGYGGHESEQADIAIDKLDDLLAIFDRRLPIFRAIAHAATKKKVPGRALVIGVNGIDCSGKTFFAAGLEAYLKGRGYAVQLINLDDFHQPRRLRHAVPDERYYDQVKQGQIFNFRRLIDELLAPTRRGVEVSKTLVLLDWQTDKLSLEKEFCISRDGIVILEGVYLFLKALAPYIDYKVYLDVPFEICLERARARDPEDVVRRYQTRYFPAQRRYLAGFPPGQTADIIVNNVDGEHPCLI